MNCKKVTTELVFLFDDEMGQELRVAFLSHVEHCPHCARKVRVTRRFMTVVRKRVVRISAPRSLRVKILAGFAHRRDY